MGVKEHREHGVKRIRFAIVITTDSRDDKSDISGKLMRDMIKNAGHELISFNFSRNSAEEIESTLKKLLNGNADIIIFSGGTGISEKDITVDVVAPFFEKVLNGFGELFRYLSMREIGSAAMMSRACAGVVNKKIVFCLPGSSHAVKLAMEDIILKEAGHMVYEVRK
ncbi:MAG: molybdenum cofactor biosynthesis protein MoaB [Thermoplasmata archaeon]|nr:molybdenum cofactor biosynthesis protein MoaB [Thermoplasmata archaeon]